MLLKAHRGPLRLAKWHKARRPHHTAERLLILNSPTAQQRVSRIAGHGRTQKTPIEIGDIPRRRGTPPTPDCEGL